MFSIQTTYECLNRVLLSNKTLINLNFTKHWIKSNIFDFNPIYYSRKTNANYKSKPLCSGSFFIAEQIQSSSGWLLCDTDWHDWVWHLRGFSNSLIMHSLSYWKYEDSLWISSGTVRTQFKMCNSFASETKL